MATKLTFKVTPTLLGLLLAALSSQGEQGGGRFKKKPFPAASSPSKVRFFSRPMVSKGRTPLASGPRASSGKKFLSAVLAVCGVTRNSARKIMACMVAWNKACDKAVSSRAANTLALKCQAQEQAKWIQQFVQQVVYTDAPTVVAGVGARLTTNPCNPLPRSRHCWPQANGVHGS